MAHNLQEYITEIEREIRMREQVYPGLIKNGKMLPEFAKERIKTLENLLMYLRAEYKKISQGELF